MTDREKLIDILKSPPYGEYSYEDLADHLIANGVTVQKHGRWKLNKSGSGTCSECHRTQNDVWDYDTWQRYCGSCGAKMD